MLNKYILGGGNVVTLFFQGYVHLSKDSGGNFNQFLQKAISIPCQLLV